MLLVDTSVWVAVFSRPPGLDFNEVAEIEDVVTCLPVVQEVLQGFGDQAAFTLAREAMLALPIVESPLGKPVFLEATEMYRAARRAGVTVRSSVDCLVAACALRNGLTVLHRDRDFDNLARVSGLQVIQAN